MYKTKQYLVLHLFAIILILVYIAPMLLLGENAHVRIGDNLDSNVIWYKLLIYSNKIFASSFDIVQGMMGGLPRISFPNEFDFLLWLNKWFGPIYGYAFNQLFMRLVAYIGLYLLLSKYILLQYHLKRTTLYTLSACVALSFAYLPFWPSGGLSVAGLPLLTYALLNIFFKKYDWKDWIIVVLLPFYSSFILVYFFYLGFAYLFWLTMAIKDKKLHGTFLLAITIMTALYLIVNYRLVLNMLMPSDYISHRKEMSIAVALGYYMKSFTIFVKSFLNYLYHGTHAHVNSYPSKIIWPVVLLSLFMAWKHKQRAILKHITLLVSVIILFSFIYKLWYYPPFDAIKSYIPLLKQFNLGRIAWLNPMLFYILFAIALAGIAVNLPKKRWTFAVILVPALLQSAYLYLKSDFYVGMKSGAPTVKQFYDTETFDKVKNILSKDSQHFKVGCIEFFPAIAQYNGIPTVGGYSSNYPLSYKHEFRKIIEKTLQNNPDRKRLFDNWGSYCYLYITPPIKRYWGSKPPKGVSANISELNLCQLKKMGVTHILSVYPIQKIAGIKYLGKESSQNGFWEIYIYKIIASC